MNRQKILDNFVRTVDGKGRAMHKSVCVYFSDNHPGCAIGCQPGFKEKFYSIIDDISDIGEIRPLLALEGIGKKIKDFFSVKTEEDIDFLVSIQNLHDESDHWNDDGTLKQDILAQFCEINELTIPGAKDA